MSNFLTAYRNFIDNTEPPLNFHVWTAISTVSALLGRKCFIPQGYFTVYPQFYVVLVGPPGIKKSSALNVGKDILRSIDKFPLAPESTTREALLEVMGENKIEYTLEGKTMSYHQATAFATELSEFLGGRHINQTMVSFLTAIWDEPYFEYRTKNRGTETLNAPYFTLLAACTPSWVINNLKSDIITDGFSRRTVFVYESERHKLVPWPHKGEKELTAWKVLKAEARRIHSLGGSFFFTEEALHKWDQFYRDIQSKVLEKPEQVQSYFSSKHILVLKLCMCLSACYGNSRVVDTSILELALEFFEDTEQTLEKVFSGMGRNELKQYQVKMLDFIQAKPEGVTKRELLNQFFNDLSQQEFEEAITILEQTESIEWTTRGGKVLCKAKGTPKVHTRQDLFKKACERVERSEETPVKDLYIPSDPLADRREASNSRRKEDVKLGVLLRANQAKVIKTEELKE